MKRFGFGNSRLLRVVVGLLLAALVLPVSAGTTASAASQGSLYVYKKNSDGQRIVGSCFALFKDAGGGNRGLFVATKCDWTDPAPNDGKLVFSGLTPGSYVLHESRPPSGYALAKDRVLVIVAGQRTQVTVKDPRGGTTLTVSKTNPSGALLPGACFYVYVDAGGGQPGLWVESFCDNSDGTNDGKTVFPGLRAGHYVLIEFVAPSGYQRAANKTFAVPSSSGAVRLSIVDQPHIASETVVIRTVNDNRDPVIGACFALAQQASNPNAPGGIDLGLFIGHGGCDSNDGSTDGTTRIFDVPAGAYVAVEVLTPDGYVVAPITPFTKTAGSSKMLTVVDKIGGATLTVNLRDGQGQPVLGLCLTVYRLVDGNRGVFVNTGCDFDLTGQAVIAHLPNGRFTLRSTGWVAALGPTNPGYTLVGTPSFTLASNATKTITATFTKTGGSSVTAATAASPTATASPTPAASPTVEPSATPTQPAAETPTVEATAAPTESPTPELPTETPTTETTPAIQPTVEPSPSAAAEGGDASAPSSTASPTAAD